MNNKSESTEILEEKIIDLKGIKVKVSLVRTNVGKSNEMVRTYSNFLKNDNLYDDSNKIRNLKSEFAKDKLNAMGDKNV